MRRPRSPQGHVVWENFIAQLASVAPSKQSTPCRTSYKRDRRQSTELSYLFGNSKFDICSNLNDYSPLTLDLKRIRCDDLADTTDSKIDFSLDSLSSSFASSFEPKSVHLNLKEVNLSYDTAPICSTPQTERKNLENNNSKVPKQLNFDFDDSFSLVVNESFFNQIERLEENENNRETGAESETLERSRELLLEQTCEVSLFDLSFWMTAGQLAEVEFN